jgi:predicted dehydrogenase
MSEPINRRDFLRSGAAVGAGVLMSPAVFAVESPSQPKSKDALRLALIGAGAQGQVLMDAIIKISKDYPVQFRAVCDIWEPNRTRVARTLNAYKAYGHVGKAYTDYKEMLDTEKDLDAVIVATPDFWHAEHAIACLKKGLHVYCEKEMSNTLENAKRMVEAARASGKLLQIGHQRRSNPKYRFCYDQIIEPSRMLGRITTINGQWNRSRSACEDLGWPAGTELSEAVLHQYGFASMQQFRNWRWYKGLGGGPIVDLGSHQIDIYSWFLKTRPSSVVASGGIDYWTAHQWYDNAIAIYEFHTPAGHVRAAYETLTTNSNGGYFEQFMGDEGTLDVSESGRGAVYRESWVDEKKWYPWEDLRLIKREAGLDQRPDTKSVLDVRASPKPPKYNLLVDMNKPYHQPHLENFFESIRGHEKLNCPAEIGYETAVMVLKVNEAIEAGHKLEFKPEDFVA